MMQTDKAFQPSVICAPDIYTADIAAHLDEITGPQETSDPLGVESIKAALVTYHLPHTMIDRRPGLEFIARRRDSQGNTEDRLTMVDFASLDRATQDRIARPALLVECAGPENSSVEEILNACASGLDDQEPIHLVMVPGAAVIITSDDRSGYIKHAHPGNPEEVFEEFRITLVLTSDPQTYHEIIPARKSLLKAYETIIDFFDEIPGLKTAPDPVLPDLLQIQRIHGEDL